MDKLLSDFSEVYIDDCLKSAVAQEIDDLEIIVVNDGSTDSTLDIMKSWADRDSRICIIDQKNSGSPAGARNRGLSEAQGEFVAFLDSDDLIHKDRLLLQLNVFRAYPDRSIVFCDVVRFREEPESAENICHLHDSNFIERASNYLSESIESGYLCADNFYNFMSTQITTLGTQNIMVRRDLIMEEDVWFPEDMVIGEDIDLWFRLAKRGRLAFLDIPLSYYRLRDDSISHESEEQFLLGSLAAHGANYDRGKMLFSSKERKLLSQRLAGQYFSLGYLYSKAHNARAAREVFLKALKFEIRWPFILAYIKTWFLRYIYKAT